MLLAGFAGALRRSELAAIELRDLTWVPDDGLHLRIRTSKTNQESASATIALPYGTHPGTWPPCAALRWLGLLEAARHGRPALMRAVLTAPPWGEQTHLYDHPGPGEGAGPSAAVGEDGTCRAAVADVPDKGTIAARDRRQLDNLADHALNPRM